MEKTFHIALLFNANKAYDRQIIEGVGKYLQRSRALWDVYIADDFRSNIDSINGWNVDGVIADCDVLAVEQELNKLTMPVVGIGGSYSSGKAFPNLHYVATDNYSLVATALEHLINKGMEHFALYSFPACPDKRWATERENAFAAILQQKDRTGLIYRGHDITIDNWQTAQNQLADWVTSLPEGTGIVAVTDSRARHLLQICENIGIPVPEKLAIIGIDNEELTQHLSGISLSSVVHGAIKMGSCAAEILHKLLKGESLPLQRVVVPPLKLVERRSSNYRSIVDPYVIRAMNFIRDNACKGIKAEQVISFTGISRTSLEIRFKAHLGATIHTVIHNEKIEHARNLLITTDLPMKEISLIAGYPSVQYFYLVFRKTYNLTPKAYRSRYQEQNRAS
ncbi:XylR family transcriptional regulator [Pantoea deleyi]|uniref:Helix-turn-helix domain-containing protein n=1 Tax=Pantoea deleyi TaxID=470932 RepID=A0A506Q0X3_9GAMM|nr:DNA-binding transcriptional regulator [Pantoea deleyi]ORM82064.1 XylR family transcriptional regulator [Pantoea deleyi]TPV39773.1 helix-turn-helix domain-containing protein [Pantoea deleyi]